MTESEEQLLGFSLIRLQVDNQALCAISVVLRKIFFHCTITRKHFSSSVCLLGRGKNTSREGTTKNICENLVFTENVHNDVL